MTRQSTTNEHATDRIEPWGLPWRVWLGVILALLSVVGFILCLTDVGQALFANGAGTAFAIEHPSTGDWSVFLLIVAVGGGALLAGSGGFISNRLAVAQAVVVALFVVVGTLLAANYRAGSDVLLERVEAKYGIEVSGGRLGTRDDEWVIDGVKRRCDSRGVETNPTDPVLRCAPPDPQDVKTELGR